jgi:RecA/RadA recombinase
MAKKEEQVSGPSLAERNTAFLKARKEYHENDIKEVYYRVSMGTLNADIALSGGLPPGIHRFTGASEGGKSSAAFEVAREFQKTVIKPRVAYINAEGKFPKDLRDRTGLKFTWDPKEWDENTIFVFDCNIFEPAIAFMRENIMNNPENYIFLFILDAVDSLTPIGDLDKVEGESNKVAGGQVILSTMLKRMNLSFCKRGHMGIFISQVRSNVKIDPYSPIENQLKLSGTGGNALIHYANFILDFEHRYKGDLILSNPKEKQDDIKNPIIGHFVKFRIKKSSNEKTGRQVQYPVLYGRKGQSSVWIEEEITQNLIAFEFFEKSGAWLKVTEKFEKELTDAKLTISKQIQGIDKLREELTDNKAVLEYCYNKFQKTLAGI